MFSSMLLVSLEKVALLSSLYNSLLITISRVITNNFALCLFLVLSVKKYGTPKFVYTNDPVCVRASVCVHACACVHVCMYLCVNSKHVEVKRTTSDMVLAVYLV